MKSPSVKTAQNYGYLEFISKQGKPSHKYVLKLGQNTLGSSNLNNIRIKSKDIEPLSCVINVKKNGSATFENKCRQNILINDVKVNKIKILKNSDRITIAARELLYVNNNPSLSKIANSVKVKERLSVTPNFKIKSTFRTPVAIKDTRPRRSFSTIKTARDLSRRSCASALPDHKRHRINDWETIATPNNARSFRPSLSMQKADDMSVAVRKALFLKNKGNVSFASLKSGNKYISSDVSVEDSLSSSILNITDNTPSPRGFKRRRESSCDGSLIVYKRRKYSQDNMIFLSVSGRDSFLEESGSLSSSSQESPLVNVYQMFTNANVSMKSPKNDFSTVKGVKKSFGTPEIQNSSINSLSDVREDVRRSFKTPKVQKSPVNDLTDVRGVKKLLKTPKVQKSPINDLTDVKGVKKLLKTPKVQKSPVNDLTDVKGVKKLLKTPKVRKSPRNDLTDVRGVKKIMKTPKFQKSPVNDLTDVRGVKKLLKTPKVRESPRNDLTDIRGVKKLLKTPKAQRSPFNDLTDVRGVKRLLRTPKYQKSPVNDLTDVRGVKKLLNSPKEQKSPLNDLTDVRGVKKIMKTPKMQKSPLNDLTNVSGVKKLMKTSREQKSPLNDLTDVEGVNKLFQTATVELMTLDDWSKVSGIKRLLRTPKPKKSPKNDLTDVRGVKKMLKTPKIRKSPRNDLMNVSGVKELMSSPIPEETLNTTLEKLHQEFSNDPDVHNSTVTEVLNESASSTNKPRRNLRKNKDQKSEESPTVSAPNAEKEISEEIKLSQRGRRIRKKEIGDDFVESPRTKSLSTPRNMRSRKQETVENPEQVPVRDNVDTHNLKEEVKMPQRNVRGGKKDVTAKASKEISDTKVTVKRSARNRNKKDTVEKAEISNVEEATEKVVEVEEEAVKVSAQKRGKKKETANVKMAETEAVNSSNVDTEETKIDEEQKVVKRGGRGRKAEAVNDAPQEEKRTLRGRRKVLCEEIEESPKAKKAKTAGKRPVRGKKAAAVEEAVEVTEEVPEIEEKRPARGRKMKTEVVEEVPETEEKRPVRGRKMKIVEEIKEKRPLREKKAKSEVEEKGEEVVEEAPQKRRGRAGKEVESTEIAAPKAKRTRGGRKVAETKKIVEEAIEDKTDDVQVKVKKGKIEKVKNGLDDSSKTEESPIRGRRGRYVKKVE